MFKSRTLLFIGIPSLFLIAATIIPTTPGSHEGSNLSHIDYTEVHKDAVIKIALENPLDFFLGSDLINQGAMSADAFIAESSKSMPALLAHPLYITKLLMLNHAVIGFVTVAKMREPSLESSKQLLESQGMTFTQEMEQQLLEAFPAMKATDAESYEFAQIDCLAVTTAYRGKGFGTMLLDTALQTVRTNYPTLHKVILNVNAHNSAARNLYTSYGFKVSAVQPPWTHMIAAVQYEFILN